MSRATIWAIGILLISAGTAHAEPQISLADISLAAIVRWAITLCGVAVAAWWAMDAFDRPSINIADQAILPRYMTNQSQYRLGVFIFILFSCGFFLLLVIDHEEVFAVLSLLDGWGMVPKGLADAAKERAAPYLLVVGLVGAIYLYLLKREGRWNVLLMMRDVIQRWISIPQLAREIVTQIKDALRVPEASIAKVLTRSPGLVREDFAKDRATPDRIWATTCYMEWWLNDKREAGDDATFFEQDGLDFDKVQQDFQQLADGMRPLNDTAAAQFKIAMRPTVEKLYKGFSRLVACYLLYHTASRKDLCAEAERFGMKFPYQAPDNPLRYWIVYVIALVISVHLGVYISAVGFDLLHGTADFAQDPQLAWAWVMYTLSNFGLAILAVLLIRLALRMSQLERNQSHLITYCWTFVVGVLVGPLGLTIAVHFSPYPNLREMSLPDLYFLLIQWGIAPGLVCVYISYYLDRQTYYDLPNIVHSPATFAWRLLNCFAFAALTVFLLMPSILTVKATPPIDAWSTAKLQFVSAGCTFFLVLGLALAAQFALRKGTQEAAPRLPATALAS